MSAQPAPSAKSVASASARFARLPSAPGQGVLDPPGARRPRSQTRPRLTVAPPPPPRVAVPRAPFIGLVLLVVVGGVFGILLLNTKIDENAFRIDELREEQAALDQRQQELEEEIAEASSAAQLAAAARQLGLVRVPNGEVGRLQLPDGEVVGDPEPVAPGPDSPAAAGDGPEPGSDDGPEPGSEEE